jgi:blue copper oxidase
VAYQRGHVGPPVPGSRHLVPSFEDGGRAVDPSWIGLKDVVHVEGPTELLVRFEKRAENETPFMYHCHILEHEDAGMIGQFTVG